MGCQMMVAANKTLCNEPCFVSTCPRTCGKCAECYSCNQVSNVDDCNSTTTCLTGEACTRFHAQAGQIFGKRGDSFQISFKGDCCTGDLCNHKQLGPSPTNNSHKSSVRNLYIGAVDKTGKGYYTWDTTGGSVFTDTTNHRNYCVTISIGSRGHYTETNCNSLHQPLCMAAKQ
ncbi:hypothetical protein FSP39_000937 [Pinctada imbricata]|uniref:C-type lectin domain-containing protein n=1 Tax=Pinctada imbricata TaxID=66713 RepID=A0AA88Y2D0_PINIB|nr:hypothetical protein FSP39_000937 [Pinctada imbricata]